jgi:protein ImuB
LGIYTLGGFLALPASEIRSRLGPEAHRLHQLARGDLWAPIQPEPPVEQIIAKTIIDYPESNHVRLLVIIEKLLQPLLDSLDKRNERMNSLVLHLFLEDRSERIETLRPANSTLDASQIFNLLQLRMSAIALTAGVIEIRIELHGTPPDFLERELFQSESARDYEAANRALARLRAQFGDGALVRARYRAGHLPEASFAWEPMETMPPPRPRKVRLHPLVRRFFPRPIELRGERKGGILDFLKEIKNAPFPSQNAPSSRGPYIVSGGWWGSRGVHREYHFLRSNEGQWLWVYYDRKRGKWFLHGKVE